jgi:hypothetical protein
MENKIRLIIFRPYEEPRGENASSAPCRSRIMMIAGTFMDLIDAFLFLPWEMVIARGRQFQKQQAMNIK